MRQTIRKASRSLYKTRSGSGLGKGSHQPVQSLVGRLNLSVRKPDERMGFVQSWTGEVSAVSRPGGSEGCRRLTDARLAAGWGLLACHADARLTKKPTLCPPPLTLACGGLPQFFPAISVGL